MGEQSKELNRTADEFIARLEADLSALSSMPDDTRLLVKYKNQEYGLPEASGKNAEKEFLFLRKTARELRDEIESEKKNLVPDDEDAVQLDSESHAISWEVVN